MIFVVFTLKNNQFINSHYNFNTLSSRQVYMRFKKIITTSFCLDIIPNSQ